MAKGRLKDNHKTFVVQQLACYEYPSDVAKAVVEAFPADKLEVTRQQIEYYDPTKRASSNGLDEKWVKLFWATREQYNDEEAQRGMGNLNYRLTRLKRLADKAEQSKLYREAREFYETAAKDQGGLFTNKRKMEVDARANLAALLGVPVEELPAPESDDAKP
jgi:hypothetical protein